MNVPKVPKLFAQSEKTPSRLSEVPIYVGLNLDSTKQVNMKSILHCIASESKPIL